MASSLVFPTQLHWDDTLARLMNISSATMKRNAELEAQLAELEVERSVWKSAHAAALGNAERDAKAHNAQIASLNKQLSSLDLFQEQDPLIFCIVDNMFSIDLIRLGAQGGRQAAQTLTHAIAEYLTNEEVQTFRRLSFWVTIFFDKANLVQTLVASNKCTLDQLDEFIIGLSHASPRFLTVDAGRGREATLSKIKEYVMTYTAFPQTLRVFYAPAYDASCCQVLSFLQKKDLLGKAVVAHGSDFNTTYLQDYPVKSMNIDNLFLSPIYTPPMPSTSYSATLIHNTSTSFANMIGGGLPSPRSSLSGSSGNLAEMGGPKLLDPDLPLHKQNPPPCNEFYLMNCFKGHTCRYSHEYDLTDEERRVLATNAKKAPCNFLKNGMICPYGDKCCWGHACPNGPKCFHLSKGKCWFKGDSMHPSGATRAFSPPGLATLVR